MGAIDTWLVVIILVFILLITWSRIMKQSVSDTVKEIKSMVVGDKEE